jgi:hypothetical protein
VIAQELASMGIIADERFKCEQATGAPETAIVLCAVPDEIVETHPKNDTDISAAKTRSALAQTALELFPAVHALLARKRDHGRARAALLCNSRVIAAPPGAQPGSTASNIQSKGRCIAAVHRRIEDTVLEINRYGPSKRRAQLERLFAGLTDIVEDLERKALPAGEEAAAEVEKPKSAVSGG